MILLSMLMHSKAKRLELSTSFVDNSK